MQLSVQSSLVGERRKREKVLSGEAGKSVNAAPAE